MQRFFSISKTTLNVLQTTFLVYFKLKWNLFLHDLRSDNLGGRKRPCYYLWCTYQLTQIERTYSLTRKNTLRCLQLLFESYQITLAFFILLNMLTIAKIEPSTFTCTEAVDSNGYKPRVMEVLLSTTISASTTLVAAAPFSNSFFLLMHETMQYTSMVDSLCSAESCAIMIRISIWLSIQETRRSIHCISSLSIEMLGWSICYWRWWDTPARQILLGSRSKPRNYKLSFETSYININRCSSFLQEKIIPHDYVTYTANKTRIVPQDFLKTRKNL